MRRLGIATATVGALALLFCIDGDAPAAPERKPSGAARTTPFCHQPDLRQWDAGRLLLTLETESLLLPCAELATLAFARPGPEVHAAVAHRAQLADQYGELRLHFTRLRAQWRQLPRDEALDRAQNLLPVALSRAVLPLWLGTTWDFAGASDVPGRGSIACGYFVASSLHAVGFQLRHRELPGGRRYFPLATHASEPVLRQLVARASVSRFSNRPVSDVVAKVQATGPGVYLVGLDQHVGFLVYDGDGPVWFWHAKPGHEVRLERPAEAPYFADSRYRVLAPLDRRTAELWLDGQLVHLPRR